MAIFNSYVKLPGLAFINHDPPASACWKIGGRHEFQMNLEHISPYITQRPALQEDSCTEYVITKATFDLKASTDQSCNKMLENC